MTSSDSSYPNFGLSFPPLLLRRVLAVTAELKFLNPLLEACDLQRPLESGLLPRLANLQIRCSPRCPFDISTIALDTK
ncbi:hypothetical protein Tco_1124995 [Tanacetum coccineum]|uniref:Uncharacterized protein n=1 Tax=Tanacetum coccineum TaxID=301880 RepID=A0ABQ5J7Q9_9ASTR